MVSDVFLTSTTQIISYSVYILCGIANDQSVTIVLRCHPSRRQSLLSHPDSTFRKSVDGGRDLSDLLDEVNTLQNSSSCMQTH
jgi:hypothetical protein